MSENNEMKTTTKLTNDWHEWEPVKWRIRGRKPVAIEWECTLCGEVVWDGGSAASEYCSEEVWA
tara:strand:- start:116 stop:307 length:192 start_codon:yes stop_codon:yes gene_type:complete